MKEQLLSKEDIRKISPIFKGFMGNLLIKLVIKLTGINKINHLYDSSKQYESIDFCKHLLKNAGVKIIIENIEILDQFKNQPFITVSNHPYGHLDGITAISAIGSVRPDYKMMVNYILGIIDTMAMHFIIVNPYKNGKLATKSSVEGIKEGIEHLKEGKCLGFFPAGAVSKTKIKGLKLVVEDRPWQPSVVKLIKKVRIPVIPMYFSGKNSFLFNMLDIISWKLRTFRLGHELANKKGKTIYVKLGKPIMPEIQDQYSSTEDFGKFLRAKTYELNKK